MKQYLRKRKDSFKFAFRGIGYLFSHESNAKIHIAAAISVIIAGILFKLTAWEWCAVSFAIGGVLTAEAFNTAIEKICDKISPDIDPIIKIVKDVAAGAVLLFVLSAIAIGLIIFIPKIFGL